MTAPHPLVTRARSLADGLLAPHAEQVDQEEVPTSHLTEIRRSGLLGLNAPKEYGGAGAPGAVLRETAEILAGACCSTWFVQAQHHTPVLTLAGNEGPARERLLGPLARGELLSGVAYAHLRAYPRVPVRVTPERVGWRFDGTVPWYTGWGLNDVLLLAGVTDTGEVLFAFTEAREQPGLRASAPMRLAALGAARTVSLELDGLWLPEEAVALRTPHERWSPHGPSADGERQPGGLRCHRSGPDPAGRGHGRAAARPSHGRPHPGLCPRRRAGCPMSTWRSAWPCGPGRPS